MNKLTFDKNSFYLDGEPFRMIAGDIHYFRIHPKDWEKRLDLALDFGLNTIQTYVPWNMHEPRPGEFDFSGMLDLGAYLKLCQEKGLKVLLRPAPYICSEWDLGGLPSWLLADKEMILRTHDPKYLDAVRRYYDRLIPEFLPYLATNGGPIIAVAAENEYGSYGNDHEYMRAMVDMLKNAGVDVPLYTTDGNSDFMLTFGMSADCFFGVNYRAKPGDSIYGANAAHKFGQEQPFFVGEFWAGRSMHWGEPFHHRDPQETATALKEALELGGNICFYMFSGGTNFGFMGGANIGHSYSPRPNTPARYIPHTTSYSADTMIGEGGELTEKYFMCRDVLDEYFGGEKRPHVYSEHPTQTLTVTLSHTADLFENLDALTETKEYSIKPKPMEDYEQSYGLILYSTKLDAFEQRHRALAPSKYRDRASIYIDGEWFATFLRDRALTKVADGVKTVGNTPSVEQVGNARHIDVLVENIGRVNFGAEMPYERKGMEDCILYAGAKLFGYETRTLPLGDLSRLCWQKNNPSEHKPCFYRGYFDAKSGVDTYINFESFGHGYIWINGFNLGRYDSAGPQMTLYCPGHLLKATDNELIILDIDPSNEVTTILLSNHEILEGDASELS